MNDAGVKVTILPKHKYTRRGLLGVFSPKVKGLYTYICSIQPDIIMQHGLAEWCLYDILRYKRENRNVKLYIDSHRDFYNAPLSLKQRILDARFCVIHKLLPRYTEKFWGVTPWRVDYLHKAYGIPADKIDLLVMGADESKIRFDQKDEIRQSIREKYNIPQDAFLVVSGGRLEPRKKMEILAEAIAQFGQQNNIFLLLFGQPVNGYTDLEKYEIHSNIRMIGWVSSEYIYDLFLAADLAVFPATHSVLWEQAVACGLPAIFQKWEGMSHVNVNGNALLLDEVTVDKLHAAILSLHNTALWQEMYKKAQEVKGLFFYKNIALKAIGFLT